MPVKRDTMTTNPSVAFESFTDKELVTLFASMASSQRRLEKGNIEIPATLTELLGRISGEMARRKLNSDYIRDLLLGDGLSADFLSMGED
jgi:hypothetical protein